MEDACQRVKRWMEDAPRVLQMMAELFDERERAPARDDVAGGELERLRGEVAAVRADNGLLLREQTQTSDLLVDLVGKMGEMLRRISAPSLQAPVVTGSSIPPVAPATAAEPPGVAPVAVKAAEPGPGDATAVTAPPLAEARPRRILLVDDDGDFRAMMIQYLVDHRGYEVLPAASGEDGLRLLGDFEPEVVLLDLMMPGIGGMETLRQIKAQWPHICVVMVTANEDLSMARKALALGATDYLTKPFDPDYLDAILNIYVTRKDAVLPPAPSASASVDRDVPARSVGSFFARR